MYKNALTVDETSPEARLSLAAEILERCKGVVILNNRLALRPEAGRILCEVIDLAPSSHRCAEEFAVLVENAQRALASSKLKSKLPKRPMEWLVVENCGADTVELWRPRIGNSSRHSGAE